MPQSRRQRCRNPPAQAIGLGASIVGNPRPEGPGSACVSASTRIAALQAASWDCAPLAHGGFGRDPRGPVARAMELCAVGAMAAPTVPQSTSPGHRPGFGKAPGSIRPEGPGSACVSASTRIAALQAASWDRAPLAHGDSVAIPPGRWPGLWNCAPLAHGGFARDPRGPVARAMGSCAVGAMAAPTVPQSTSPGHRPGFGKAPGSSGLKGRDPPVGRHRRGSRPFRPHHGIVRGDAP